MCMYLSVKFEVSTIILTRFLPTPPLPPQNEPLKILPRLGLNQEFLISQLVFFL